MGTESSTSHPDPLEEAAGLVPTWQILVPLVAVVGALIALALVPPLVTRQNAELRRDLVEVLTPLATLQTQFERSVASEAASARGFAATGDPFFSDRFIEVSGFAESVGMQLDSLARVAGGPVAAAAADLREERERWERINFGLAPADFRERIPEHQRRFEALMGAVQEFDEAIDREVASSRLRIEEAEDRRSLATVILAIVAIFAAVSALSLAYRLRRSSKHLIRHAREETALRRIAQTMAQADDLAGALDRIVRMVADTFDADGAHIEQVDVENDTIEVIAVTGAAVLAEGMRAPYRDSLAEEVITKGRAERTSVAAFAREGRPMADHLLAGGDRRLLAVPLLSEGEAVGALVLVRSGAAFEETEVQRTRLLADMAALVLRRLHLFAEIRAKEQALAATADQLRRLNRTLEERVAERTQRAQELARDLTLAEQRERRGLAQALHDDLQQVLYGLQLGLESLELQAPNLGPDGVQPQLRYLRTLAEEAIGSTRRLTVDLSPPVLIDEGLVEALEWLAAHMQERFGLTVTVEAEASLPMPSEDLRVIFFQTVRELLFNTVKHADTDRAVIILLANSDAFAVEVIDEGVGFDMATASAQSNGTLGGFGLRRARERLSLFGGRVDLHSAPGCGTRAVVSVPLTLLKTA